MIQIPIVAISAFAKDYPSLNKWEVQWYYKQQCAMKFIWGIKAKIKFIK
jgi:hypothetical protein